MNSKYSHRRTASAHGVRPLSTALNVLEVLDALSALRHGAKLLELANRLGVSSSTAYQRLLTLVHAGWVEQVADGRYQLSLKAVRVAEAALEQADLGKRMVPYLSELATEVGETVCLAVLRGGHPHVVQRVEEGDLLRALQPLGTAFKLHTSASGRVLYAFADEQTAREVAQQVDIVPSDDVCSKTRLDGYALSDDETDVLVIAAPLFDHNNSCRTALCVVGPKSRVDPSRIVAPLLAMAARLTELLQGGEP